VARRDTTGAVARHHARIGDLRRMARILTNAAKVFEGEKQRAVRMEAEAIVRLLESAVQHLGDESPRVDVEQAERRLNELGKRLCALIRAVTNEVTHYHDGE
jgi:hypothetical protein